MQLKTKLAAATAAAGVLAMGGAPAFAQSTAGQVQEIIVTGSRAPVSVGGLATQVNEAKDQAIIGQAFIQTRTPSANIGQIINMLPGVIYSAEDPGGFNSGDLRIHGFDSAHIAVVLDGAPAERHRQLRRLSWRVHHQRADRPHHGQHRLQRRGQPLGLGPGRHRQRGLQEAVRHLRGGGQALLRQLQLRARLRRDRHRGHRPVGHDRLCRGRIRP
ncbi:MAG: Plug domain-containing protein [Caulobacteraceae bacterium]